MVNLEEARMRMSYEIAVYREQLSMLRREMERISMTAIDIANAAQAVEGVMPQRVLVPVGGGTYVKANVNDTRVLVPVGAEFIVEMGQEEAAVELRRRAEATKQAITRLNEEFERITGKLREVTTSLQGVEQQALLHKQVEAGVKEDYI